MEIVDELGPDAQETDPTTCTGSSNATRRERQQKSHGWCVMKLAVDLKMNQKSGTRNIARGQSALLDRRGPVGLRWLMDWTGSVADVARLPGVVLTTKTQKKFRLDQVVRVPE